MPITGVGPGQTGTFQIGLVPPNGVLQSGPTVETPDTSGLITLSAVDANDQFTASVDASYTLPTFIVGVDGTNGDGTTVHADFVIPVLAAPPTDVSDFTLDQIGMASAKKKK